MGIPASVCGNLRTVFWAPNLMDASGKLVFEDYPSAEKFERQCGIPADCQGGS